MENRKNYMKYVAYVNRETETAVSYVPSELIQKFVQNLRNAIEEFWMADSIGKRAYCYAKCDFFAQKLNVAYLFGAMKKIPKDEEEYIEAVMGEMLAIIKMELESVNKYFMVGNPFDEAVKKLKDVVLDDFSLLPYNDELGTEIEDVFLKGVCPQRF